MTNSPMTTRLTNCSSGSWKKKGNWESFMSRIPFLHVRQGHSPRHLRVIWCKNDCHPSRPLARYIRKVHNERLSQQTHDNRTFLSTGRWHAGRAKFGEQTAKQLAGQNEQRFAGQEQHIAGQAEPAARIARQTERRLAGQRQIERQPRALVFENQSGQTGEALQVGE